MSDTLNTRNRYFYISMTEQNFIMINNEQEEALKESLLSTYFAKDRDMSTEYSQMVLHDHMIKRLSNYRKKLIPWLEWIYPLKNSRILEIGCGTGSTTVALCEQGAEVCGIDIDKNSIEVAKTRLEIYGLHADLRNVSAVDIENEFREGFDFIIYTASLEHMTYSERLKTIRASFNMINECQHIVLVDIPNRLWHTDIHSSYEPFYFWLPDDLGMDYAKIIKKEAFNFDFNKDSKEDIIRFYRRGRGVSYHEIEVAVGSGNFEVVSCLNDFFEVQDSKYKEILIEVGPKHIHSGFYNPLLEIALKKRKQ